MTIQTYRAAYQRLIGEEKISWTGYHHMLKLLGRGGQGEVYLTEHLGTDGFTVPVAMKFFCRNGIQMWMRTRRQWKESPASLLVLQ